MKVLVVGGAGYIGSHMVKQLSLAGHKVVILDNLSTGFRELAIYGELVIGDLADINGLEQLFSNHEFDAVMHFAAASLVGESVQDPAKYYRNNVLNTLNLLETMVRHQVLNFIFSSTAATFGEPVYTPIDESHPQNPINPYGRSKLMVEQMLQDFATSYGLNSVALRYFNAAAADPEGELGELHQPETHLIPLILQAASGRRESITIYGQDYPTEDGTCIRDYIHIEDLCSAHALALTQLVGQTLQGANAFNLGNGSGFSVQQVINAVRQIVEAEGYQLKVESGERRSGDPAVLVADASLAKKVLNWQPKYPEIETIIRHAWQWEKQQIENAN